MLQFILLIILVAGGLGWFFGYRYGLQRDLKETGSVLAQYFLGVNYLLNEQPDQAVNAFLKALEVNIHTAEIYLALGNLFRRQGKLERAIRVHQALFAYPNLGITLLGQAYLELASDYLASGIFNQAEEQLLALLPLKYQEEQALGMLLNLYQIQQEWNKEIEIALRLEDQFKQDQKLVLEHCYCELAKHNLGKKDFLEADKWLKKALKIEPTSVRANYLLAHSCLIRKDVREMIEVLRKGLKQYAPYWDELFPLLIDECWKVGVMEELISLFQKLDLKIVGLALAECLFLMQSRQAGEEVLYKILQFPQHFKGFRRFLNLADRYTIDLTPYQTLMERHLLRWVSQKEEYSCHNCGFVSQNFYWCCPGCHKWETVQF